MREIVFDTETTGVDPLSGDRIVEIGCIELIDGVETGVSWHRYINPERSMPAEAFAVHGLSDSFLADKPRFADLVEEFLEFVGDDARLIAHNAAFDFGFLDAELNRCRRDPLCRTRMVDTMAIARARHPGAKHSLDALCVRYGIDRSHRVKHGALLDAELLAQVYIELNGGRQIGLALGALDALAGDDMIRIAPRERPYRTPRPHAASAAELAAHAAFIAKMPNAIWLQA